MSEMTIYTEKDANPAALKSKRFAVIGYGSQGRAHALNLHDSGCDVTVGVRDGSPSAAKAKEDGLKIAGVAQAAKNADVIVILTPDTSHGTIFENDIAPNLNAGDVLVFAHGFSVLYNLVNPPKNVDVIMGAPKGPGDLVRREYEAGRGVPCLFSVYQDATGNAREKAMAYVSLIGGTRTGVLETSFREETETDLFGEQAVLCGGATELVMAGYETLVQAGYKPEMAYYECLHELKLIVDLLYEGGMTKMYQFISETAAYGDFVSGPRVINDETKARMRDVLDDIRSGKFADNWKRENVDGKKNFDAMKAAKKQHEIEATGARLRGQISWLQK